MSLPWSDTAEVSAVELSSLEKCLTIIVDSLSQKSPAMVKAVRDLVSELCRITLLWDEMWLAALMQRQGEVHRSLFFVVCLPMLMILLLLSGV